MVGHWGRDGQEREGQPHHEEKKDMRNTEERSGNEDKKDRIKE